MPIMSEIWEIYNNTIKAPATGLFCGMGGLSCGGGFAVVADNEKMHGKITADKAPEFLAKVKAGK